MKSSGGFPESDDNGEGKRRRGRKGGKDKERNDNNSKLKHQ
jgi:hypothetical protein